MSVLKLAGAIIVAGVIIAAIAKNGFEDVGIGLAVGLGAAIVVELFRAMRGATGR